MPLAPREELERKADGRQRAERADGAAQTARSLGSDACCTSCAEQERRDEMRSAALVLLGRVGRVDTALVAGHGLVLGSVVAHQLAAAQRDERRNDADQRGAELAAQAPASLDDGGEGCAQQRGAGDAAVLEREPGLGQAAPDHRQGGEHLGHAHDAACERHAICGAEARAGTARHPDAAVGRAHRRRPRGRAEQRQAVAQRHASEAQLLVTHATTDPILSMQCTNERTASSRSRTSMRSSGA